MERRKPEREGTTVTPKKAAEVRVTVMSRAGNGAIRFGTEMTEGIGRFVGTEMTKGIERFVHYQGQGYR